MKLIDNDEHIYDVMNEIWEKCEKRVNPLIIWNFWRVWKKSKKIGPYYASILVTTDFYGIGKIYREIENVLERELWMDV